MDSATLFSYIVTIACGVIGWFVKLLWSKFSALEKMDVEFRELIAEIQLQLARSYVTKESMDRKMDALFTKLDRIEEKLDRKADK